MYCTKCGKEIPDGENKLCEDCEKDLVNEITSNEVEENIQKEIPQREKKVKEVFSKIKGFIITHKKILILALFIIILLVILLNVFNSKKVGNTIANIRNYGYAAENGNWIYFTTPNNDATKVGIFKIKKGDTNESSKEELIMDSWDNILSLNVKDNYIYFIGILSEVLNEDDVINNKIYRMKTNGSGLEVINDNEFDNECYEIYVINDSIYYIGENYNIYKMDLDGKNKTRVLENQTGYLGITEKYIVYNLENEEGTDYVTYVSELDGQNARPIIKDTRLYSVNIVDNYVYYTNASKQICKVKIDGTGDVVLYETTAYNMNVSGKYIYYLNYSSEEGKENVVCIYKVKADGSTETPEVVKQLEKYSTFIDVVDNWIIYMDYNQTEGFINLVKTDGKKEIKVYSLKYADVYTEQNTEDSVDVTDEVATN